MTTAEHIDTTEPPTLVEALEALDPQIEFSAQFIRAVTADHDPEGWPHFAWDVTITRSGRSYTTAYRCGIGHCTIPRHVKDDTGGVHIPKSEQWLHGKPTPPSLADVLSGMLDCESALEQRFEDWAGVFGYDADSRKAEAIYRACQCEAFELRRVLGIETVQALRGLEH